MTQHGVASAKSDLPPNSNAMLVQEPLMTSELPDAPPILRFETSKNKPRCPMTLFGEY